MDALQQELATAGTPLEIRILGINGVGLEAGNASVCLGRDIPWLQPSITADPWTSWGAGYRDVVILDDMNRFVEAFNLTTHDLRNDPEYQDLKARLIAAATPPP